MSLSQKSNTTPSRKARGKSFKEPQSIEEIIQTAEKDLLGRVPPHSVEAEQAVLCGVLIRSDLMDIISDIIQEDDFYIPSHSAIFKAFLALSEKNIKIDLVSLAEQLKNEDKLEEAGGVQYLGELSHASVSAANAEYYATIVRDKSMQRNMIKTCSEIISNCYSSVQEVGELLETSEQSVFSVTQRTAGRDFSRSEDLVKGVFEKLATLENNHEFVTGVTTGFPRLDELTAGLQPSDLIIVAARPSMGKTAFSLCLAMNAAMSKNLTVGIFSLEMSKSQLMERMLASCGHVNLSKLRRPRNLDDNDWNALYAAGQKLSSAPIYIDDTSSLSTLELRAKARRLKADKNLGLIIIDYLQLMRTTRKTDSRELEISDISRSLKALAKELDIPVVALAQLNRKVDDRSDKRPVLSDLRESGAIEQDADVILFVYREDVYAYKKPSERPESGKAEIIIGKQRNGPVGTVELLYVSPWTSFEVLAPDYLASPSESIM